MKLNLKYFFQKEPQAEATILLVDDDPLQTNILSCVINQILEKPSIALFDNVNDAKKYLESHSAPLLIISDMFFRSVEDGRDLWLYCLRKCPQTPFIINSCISQEMYRSQFVGSNIRPVLLSKRSDFEDIKTILAQALESTINSNKNNVNRDLTLNFG